MPNLWLRAKERLTPARIARLEAAAAQRTRHIRLIIQDLHHPHNVSACLRSAEAFGIQTVHVVTLTESFSPSTVTRGVHHWLTIVRHNSVDDAALRLRQDGYLIAAAAVDPTSQPLDSLPIDQPLALLLGNEHAGPDPEWNPHVRWRYTIPMVGLVESLNVSVSAAISLYSVTTRARQLIAPSDYGLTTEQHEDVMNAWGRHHLQEL